MSSSAWVLVAATLLLMVANAAKLPPGWKTCKRSLPPAEYDPCIKEAVTDAIQDLFVKGAPNLGIPRLKPLKITALDIGQGSGPVAVDIKFWDVEIDNVDSYEFVNIRSKDADKYKLGADLRLTKPIIWKSKYELSGKVLVLPIRGKGNCNLQLDDITSSIDMSGVPYKKGGETHMNVTDFVFQFETSKLHLNFENLFDGNKELGDNMNVFLNENWSEILKEMKPAIAEALSQAFKSISEQIFHRIPFKKLIPE